MTPHVIYIDLSFLTVSPLTLCVYPQPAIVALTPLVVVGKQTGVIDLAP